jgi:hypothetical protein
VRQGDGASLRTHLQRLATNTGEVDSRLNIQWPKVGRPLWDHFRRLGRPPAMSGLAPISAQEIVAYQQLYGIRFNPWELGVIELFDVIAMDCASGPSG